MKRSLAVIILALVFCFAAAAPKRFADAVSSADDEPNAHCVRLCRRPLERTS